MRDHLRRIVVAVMGAAVLCGGLAGCNSASSPDPQKAVPQNQPGKGGAMVQGTTPSKPPGADVQFGTKAGK